MNANDQATRNLTITLLSIHILGLNFNARVCRFTVECTILSSLSDLRSALSGDRNKLKD